MFNVNVSRFQRSIVNKSVGSFHYGTKGGNGYIVFLRLVGQRGARLTRDYMCYQ